MKKSVKPGDFIQKPKYIGGKEAWFKLLREEMKYPEKALEKGIEGIVKLSYQVNQNGKVTRPKVTQGLGHGCDEEAIRLVKMMKYEKVSNRKVKVTSHHKIAIQFTLPKKKKVTQSVRYQYHSVPAKPKKETPKKPVRNYSYTIKLK